LAVRMPAHRAHCYAPAWPFEFQFPMPTKSLVPTACFGRAEKREANQWLMSSVLIWRSHEVWREMAEERELRAPDGKGQSGSYRTERSSVVGPLDSSRSCGDFSHRR